MCCGIYRLAVFLKKQQGNFADNRDCAVGVQQADSPLCCSDIPNVVVQGVQQNSFIVVMASSRADLLYHLFKCSLCSRVAILQ
jgi:hypothetical protein